MKQADLVKQFEAEHQLLQEIRYQVIEAQERLEKAQDSAKCSTCERGKADLKKDVYERYQNCKFGLRCGKTVKLYKAYAGLKQQEDSIREEYAKKVFAYLSGFKPKLLNRQDKTEIPWDKAFDSDFSLLEPGLKTALVALVEQSGGRYRIIET